jgi:uncharacterized cupredoxin-like copper-binding protein
MPARRATLVAALALAAAALGGCLRERPATTAPDRTVRLRLDEYTITPQRVRVRAGRVRLVARNSGRLAHNVAVFQRERLVGDVEERVYGRTASARPGEIVTRRVRLRPGRYRLKCTFSNHERLGQYGELIVTRRRP